MEKKLSGEYKNKSTIGCYMFKAIIIVNILVFIALKISPNLTELLSLHYEIGRVIERPWTIVTVMFSHIVLIHVLGNMLVVFFLGRELEGRVGSKNLLGIYLLAGLAGSIALILSGTYVGATEPSMGASAAALGLLGTLVMLPSNAFTIKIGIDKVFAVVVVINIAMLFIDLQRFGASSFAHLAGIAVGLIYGYILKRERL